jgi:hypothetical protein
MQDHAYSFFYEVEFMYLENLNLFQQHNTPDSHSNSIL